MSQRVEETGGKELKKKEEEKKQQNGESQNQLIWFDDSDKMWKFLEKIKFDHCGRYCKQLRICDDSRN